MKATARPTRRHFLAASLALTVLPRGALAAPARIAGSPPVDCIEGSAFGTTWRVWIPRGADLGHLRIRLRSRITSIDRRMSPWRTDSEISAFNGSANGRRHVSRDTEVVARAALDLAERSNGAFDPTVGPAVARWGFGPITGHGEGNWRDMSVEGGVLAKERSGVTLDLCGIAKGYAIDMMRERLRRNSITNSLIDFGGELAADGVHPSGRLWRVAVEDPRPDHTGIAARLSLKDSAVATSGTRANGFTLGGRRYGHIIDPATGQPASGELLSVSVIAQTAMEADGWATALFAAGAKGGPRLAETNGLTALFLVDRGGGVSGVRTGDFARHEVAAS